ncbi:heterokaryon incompatibility protein-domain-containing protein [Thelonectria olida]|uniref:Heterokaryon incompatibility protein-domain-containing protein n=1 Tax=Thelonectria olida TaxID=1576542 RepID=A0A9P9AWL0_9HYPO|nr:heterokaryon incompatibility protein-domain-containing protein [Thelonectria olida]
MFCHACKTIGFRLAIPKHTNSLFAVLHQDPESFSASLALGCDLCTLISGKLGSVAIQNEVCKDLKAFMVLERTVRKNRPSTVHDISSISVASLLGNVILDVIGAIPEIYHFLYPERNTTSAQNQSEPHPRKRQKTSGTAKKADSPSSAISKCVTSTGSAENLKLAQIWLNECQNKHPQCKVNHISSKKCPLPTRLINVEDSKRPFLQETTASTKGPYIALSYCWGEGEQVRTLKSNYTLRLQSLPMDNLPRTFADAIQTTKALGYTYIWIDAFCITQDDQDDLGRELPKMGDIYQYAEFTIYSQGAQSSHAGIFVDRDARLYRPCEVTISTTIDDTSFSKKLTLATTCDGPDYLESRGWILQERVLSSRCLVFGRQMSWICTVGEAQETNPTLRLRRKAAESSVLWVLETLRSSLYGSTPRIEGPRNPQRQSSRFDLWYRMLEEYSDKKLSFVSDNLKAVSGLAALFHETHGATFAAGLWKEDLQFGLAWYVGINDERSVSKTAEGPSWSWPSVGKVRIRLRSWRSSSGPAPGVGCDVVDVDYDVTGMPNPFGLVDKAMLTVRAPVRKAIVHHTDEFSASRQARCYGGSGPEFDGIDEREEPRHPALLLHADTETPVAEVALDRPFSLGSPVPRSGRGEGAGVWQVWCVLLHAQQTRDGCRGTVLVVDESKTESNTFKRVGLGFVVGKYMDWFGISTKYGPGGSTKGLDKETIRIL